MKLALLRSIFILISCLFISACTSTEIFAEINVEEQKGLSRDLEYITVTIPLPKKPMGSQDLIAVNSETGISTYVQVIDTIQNNGKLSVNLLFPVSINANSIKTFILKAKTKKETLNSDVLFSTDGTSLDNKTYKATFNTKYDQRGGQIDNILLKNFDGTLLMRGHIPMHWSPNFAKTDVKGYYNIKDLAPNSENRMEKGRYRITKTLSGHTDKIPEIKVEGKYTFLADVPYFFFESTMTVEKDLSLSLLRNDEMTMDSLFTHVAYQKQDGSISSLELYTSELDTLEGKPIPDNTRFVSFYNKKYGYGLASIRMEYNNTNADGNRSPLSNPHTKISLSRNNGRYWNRVLIDTTTVSPMGSRYHEKNAYLIFEAKETLPEEQIVYYAERLMNPLKVTLMKQN